MSTIIKPLDIKVSPEEFAKKIFSEATEYFVAKIEEMKKFDTIKQLHTVQEKIHFFQVLSTATGEEIDASELVNPEEIPLGFTLSEILKTHYKDMEKRGYSVK